MLAGEPSVSGEVVAAAAAKATETVAAQNEGGDTAAGAAAGIFGSSSNSGEDDKSRVLFDEGGERAFGGNRWPRQETLALLKIRSDMDVAFRDASVKGPLWEEISRKMGELGYNRSSKKCKEKFENVFKYHKRTKEGRSNKGQGKTYRFFEQLEAFHQHHHHHHHHPSLHQSPSSPSPKSQVQVAAAAAAAPAAVVSVAMPAVANNNPPPIITTVTSTTQGGTNINPSNYPSQSNIVINNPSAFHNISTDLPSNWTSSSTSSDLEPLEGRRRRKRKWRGFFERLMKEVVDKQEELQKKFLEAIEKREHERIVREEAWRMQEMTRINREREILAQERSMAAAKDAAVMSFLQKLSEQQNPSIGTGTCTSTGQVTITPNILPPPAPSPVQSKPPPPPPPNPLSSAPVPLPPQPQPQQQTVFSMETMKANNGEPNYYMAASSSRWPKVEIEALIKLRTDLDSKYEENGPKGPLWEEISAGMRRIGYNRNAKRCKEKWENINKYFKKVKESNKKRPEDSKTCPYFHQLDALYREKNNRLLFRPENSVPLMVEPEQQWPPQPPPLPQTEHHHHHHQHQQQQEDDEEMDDTESDQNVEEDDNEEDEDDGGGFEIVPNKQVNSIDAND